MKQKCINNKIAINVHIQLHLCLLHVMHKHLRILEIQIFIISEIQDEMC